MSKRRTFTPEFKAQVVLEELTGVKDKAGDLPGVSAETTAANLHQHPR